MASPSHRRERTARDEWFSEVAREGWRDALWQIGLEHVEHIADQPVVAGQYHDLDQPGLPEDPLGLFVQVIREMVLAVDCPDDVDDERLTRLQGRRGTLVSEHLDRLARDA